MLYLVFNEGYSAGDGESRAELCGDLEQRLGQAETFTEAISLIAHGAVRIDPGGRRVQVSSGRDGGDGPAR